jgi:hypothetical protein
VAGPGNILIRVGAETAGAARELGNLNGPLSDVQSRGERMGAGIRKATLPAIAVLGSLAAVGVSAAKAAAEDEAAATKLAGALERTTGATKAQVAGAEDYISKLSMQTAVADDELRPALARLASATGDVHTAEERLALATDISAQSGKSLDVVTKALAAAEDGRTTALGKLVPGLDQATLKSKDMTAITAELAEKTGGAAAEAANTATGKYKLMQIQMGELQEKIGAALIPVISALAGIMLHATSIASEHTTAVKAIVAVVAALAAGVLVARAAMAVYQAGTVAVRAATAAWTAVQWLLNVALDANPIGLVVIGIAALVAGVVIAYNKSNTFREALNDVWAVMKNSPLGLLITHFGDLAGKVEDAVGWIKKIAFPKAIYEAFTGLLSTVRSVVDWISKIDFPSPPKWLGKIPGFGAIGSAGAVRSAPIGTPARAPRSAGPLGSAGAGGITINVFGATDPDGTARAIKRTLRAYDRRQGSLANLGAPA